MPDETNDYFVTVVSGLLKNLKTNKNHQYLITHGISMPNSLFSFRNVSFIEDRDIIRKLKNKNSKDLIGLNVTFIKSIREIILYPLTKIINLCLQQSVFPKILKEALVIPIYKNKGDTADVSNYRPISILPVFSKIFEKFILRKIAFSWIANMVFVKVIIQSRLFLNSWHTLWKVMKKGSWCYLL